MALCNVRYFTLNSRFITIIGVSDNISILNTVHINTGYKQYWSKSEIINTKWSDFRLENYLEIKTLVDKIDYDQYRSTEEKILFLETKVHAPNDAVKELLLYKTYFYKDAYLSGNCMKECNKLFKKALKWPKYLG